MSTFGRRRRDAPPALRAPSPSRGEGISSAVLLALTLCLSTTSAFAATERVAIVVGHNQGAPPHQPLRFAQNDAERVAALLQEVGGVKRQDLKLLQGPKKQAVLDAFSWAKEDIARIRTRPGSQVVLLVYFSSHSDAQTGLELGTEKLSWKELKQALGATGADVRLAVVDACSASGLLEVGGKPAPAFDIKLDDRLNVAGEALITSSASNEPSVEAGAFHGSVFTHHLIAGLRGAADASGDGEVTLEEAYRYAYERTVQGESGQHPGFGLRMSGHGELALTDLTTAPRLVLPEGAQAVVIRSASDGERLLEARKPDGRQIAMPPGKYDVELEKDDKSFEAAVTLAPSQTVTLDAMRLTERPKKLALVKLEGQGGFCAGEIRHQGADPKLPQLANALRDALGTSCNGDKIDGLLKSLPGGSYEFTGKRAGRPLHVQATEDALIDQVRLSATRL
ncbi:MAG: caspase family protein [Myxococcaceae bacterium]